MTNWSLKFKNAGLYIKRGGQFGIETAFKMCPMTVAPYFGYKLARYGKQGVLEAADPVFQITDTHADVMEGQIENFHTEPLVEQAESYKAFVYALGGYSQCADYYKPYLGKEPAMRLCRVIMLDMMQPSDSDLLKQIEMGAIADTRKTIKDILDDADIDLPDMPNMPNIPKIPKIPSMPKIPKMPSFAGAKIVGFFVILILLLFALGYSGMGGAIGSRVEK